MIWSAAASYARGARNTLVGAEGRSSEEPGRSACHSSLADEPSTRDVTA